MVNSMVALVNELINELVNALDVSTDERITDAQLTEDERELNEEWAGYGE
jgi:hypothetical protein